jgi:hypothetical protein
MIAGGRKISAEGKRRNSKPDDGLRTETESVNQNLTLRAERMGPLAQRGSCCPFLLRWLSFSTREHLAKALPAEEIPSLDGVQIQRR